MDTHPCDAHPSNLFFVRVGVRFALVAGVLLASSSHALVAQRVDADFVRSVVEVADSGPAQSFYRARGFSPVWVDVDGRWQERAHSALELLRASYTHGLVPSDYHLPRLEVLAVRARNGQAEPADLIDAEILLTDAVLRYGTHLLRGRAEPSLIDAEWIGDRGSMSVVAHLVTALERDRMQDFEVAVAPVHPEYTRLRNALGDLRASEKRGGWGTVGDGATLRAGATNDAVDALRQRLRVSTDAHERRLAADGAGSRLFDHSLEQAVRRFQTRHGLEPDGIVGSQTRTAMNVPIADRIAQIEINLERWRWLPDDLGRRHVRVNIPAFIGEVWDDTLTFSTRVVVGRPDRETPSFSSAIQHLVLAPYWYVPPTIAAVDKLPLIREDPAYVAASRMTLFDAATTRPIDPATIDWTSVTGAEFNRRFLLRQAPGPSNALGDVKFVFPNTHSVFLHGTPQKSLFSHAMRALSSGCVRLEDALQVAAQLLNDQPEWTPARIGQVVAQGREHLVNLSSAVPVYLLYFTAFVDPDGTLHARPDIYLRDARVRSAFTEPPPDA